MGNASIKHVRLGDIAVVTAGQCAPQGESSYCSIGVPFVKAGNLQELISGSLEDSLQCVNDEVAKRHKLKLYKAGSILFAKSGMSCMKGLVHVLRRNCYVVSHLAIVTPISEGSAKYLGHYFRFHKPNELVKDPAYPSISLSDISNIELPLPSLAEQKRIAAVLDKICELKKNAEAQIENLDFLVKSRFVEMFGDPVSNPKRWEVRSIGEFADVRIGPFGSLLHKEDYVEGGHPLINPSHMVSGRVVPDMNLTLSDGKYKELASYHLKVNDVVVARRGEIGRCALIEDNGLFCGTGSMFVRVRTNCRADYLQRVISYPTYSAQLEASAVGVTMKNINAGTIEKSLIPLPPLALQQEFAAFVEKVEKLKDVAKKSVEEMDTLYRAKLQEYFG